MRFKLKACTDPRRLAFATWSILANNTVTTSVYLLFCFLDLLIIIFYSFVLIERVHYSNYDIPSGNLLVSAIN